MNQNQPSPFDRTGIIVIAICAVLLFFTFPKPVPPPVQETKKADIAKVESDKPAEPAKTEKTAEAAPKAVSKIDQSKLKPVTLENEDISLTFSPDLKGLSTFTLKKHLVDTESKKEVTLGDSKQTSLSFKLFDAGLKTELIDVKSDSKSYSQTFAITGKNAQITESWVINEENPFLLDYSFTVDKNSDLALNLGDLGFRTAITSPIATEKGGMFSPRATDEANVTAWLAEEKDTESASLNKVLNFDQDEKLVKETASWLGSHNQYFCSVLNADEKAPFTGFLYETKSTGIEGNVLYGYGLYKDVTIPAETKSQTISLSIYLGPKEVRRMQALGETNSEILTPGWSVTSGIAQFLLKSLISLKEWGASYGIAIIIITIIIKMLFWPLTHKSTVSMKKMAKIQPQMKEIQKKYKDNFQLMQQKQMELYKEHNMSPFGALGGCLPMLIQLPVFFALFTTFRTAIELRHVEFLWASDLAAPDTIFSIPGIGLPVNPLALIMVASMYLQQIVAPTTSGGDPMQQKMMKMMPFIMLLFMYSMPAALTLYWTVNQLISIVQYFFINRKMDNEKAA